MSNVTTTTKSQADHYMAGALGLMAVCAGLTVWLHNRYVQAADGWDAARRQLHFENGKLVMPQTAYSQAVVDARLRTFLIMAVLTGLCALGMVVIVFWHRKQRLKAIEVPVTAKKSREDVSG